MKVPYRVERGEQVPMSSVSGWSLEDYFQGATVPRVGENGLDVYDRVREHQVEKRHLVFWDDEKNAWFRFSMIAECGYRGCKRDADARWDGFCPACHAADAEWYERNRWWYDRLDWMRCRLLKRGRKSPLHHWLERVRYGDATNSEAYGDTANSEANE